MQLNIKKRSLKKVNQSSKLVLISRQKKSKRFPIYDDEDVGIMKRYRNRLQLMRNDEDCESQEDIIKSSILKSICYLQLAIKRNMGTEKRLHVSRDQGRCYKSSSTRIFNVIRSKS